MEIHRKKKVVDGLAILGYLVGGAVIIVVVFGVIAALIGWGGADWWAYLLYGLLFAIAFDLIAIIALRD